MVSVRFALMAAMYVATTGAGRAQTAGPPWEPDEATVKSIEATLTLPSRAPWKSGPLDSYARYYSGMTLSGRRIIYGDLLRGEIAEEKPGIYLREPPHVRTGGGCDHIQLWYDTEAHHIVQIQCYGLG